MRQTQTRLKPHLPQLVFPAALSCRGSSRLHWGAALRQAVLGGSRGAARRGGVLKVWAVGLQRAAGASSLVLLPLQLGRQGGAAAAAAAWGSIPSGPRVWTGAGTCLGRGALALAGGVLQTSKAASFTPGSMPMPASWLSMSGMQAGNPAVWRIGTVHSADNSRVSRKVHMNWVWACWVSTPPPHTLRQSMAGRSPLKEGNTCAWLVVHQVSTSAERLEGVRPPRGGSRLRQRHLAITGACSSPATPCNQPAEWWAARGGPQRRLLPVEGLPVACDAPLPRRPGAGLLRGGLGRALEWGPQQDTGGSWDPLPPHGPAHTSCRADSCWPSADTQVEHVWQALSRQAVAHVLQDPGLSTAGSSAWETADSRQRVEATTKADEGET